MNSNPVGILCALKCEQSLTLVIMRSEFQSIGRNEGFMIIEEYCIVKILLYIPKILNSLPYKADIAEEVLLWRL